MHIPPIGHTARTEPTDIEKEVFAGRNTTANKISKIDFKKYRTKAFYREDFEESVTRLKHVLKRVPIITGTAIAITSVFNQESLVETIQNRELVVAGATAYIAGWSRFIKQKNQSETKIGNNFKYDEFNVFAKVAFNRAILKPITIGSAVWGWPFGFYLPQNTADRPINAASTPYDLWNIFDSVSSPIFAAITAATTGSLALLIAPFTAVPAAHGTIGILRDAWVAGIGKTLTLRDNKIRKAENESQLELKI